MNQKSYVSIENIKNNQLYQLLVPVGVSFDDAILATEEILVALRESAQKAMLQAVPESSKEGDGN